MTFSYQQQHFTPDELNPMNHMVQNAMKNYKQALELKYRPQQLEADIFAKKFGPLAEFSTSKLAEGLSPQQAAVARQLLMQQMTGMGQSGGGGMNQQMHPFQALKNLFSGNQQQGNQPEMGGNPLEPEQETPHYATDNEIYDMLQKGAKNSLGPGGKGNIIKSNLAGGARSLGAGKISEALGGTKVADANNAFMTAVAQAKERLRLKGYSEETLRQLDPRPDETDKSYMNRNGPLFKVAKNEEAEVPENAIPKGARLHVTLPDGQAGWIAADKREAFMKKHPDAQFD